MGFIDFDNLAHDHFKNCSCGPPKKKVGHPCSSNWLSGMHISAICGHLLYVTLIKWLCLLWPVKCTSFISPVWLFMDFYFLNKLLACSWDSTVVLFPGIWQVHINFYFLPYPSFKHTSITFIACNSRLVWSTGCAKKHLMLITHQRLS